MAFPRTLAGLLGFMVFVVFLFGVAQDKGTETSDAVVLQEQLSKSIDTVTASDNIFSKILNVAGTGLLSVQVMIGYAATFMSTQGIGGLPPEFNIFFLIISITMFIAILNWIRGTVT